MSDPSTWIWPPPHLSVSSVQAFERCPVAFERSYKLRQQEEPTAPMLFGRVIAECLEILHADDGRDYKLAFVEKYSEAVRQLATQRASMFIPPDLGLDLLSLYEQNRYFGTPERGFRLYLPDKRRIPIPIKGYIDLATDDEVIEFKTSRATWDQERVEASHQAHVYAWAYEQIYGTSPNCVRFVIFSTREADIKELVMAPTQDGLEQFTRSAESAWKAIVNDEFPIGCKKCIACREAKARAKS
jgi:hypothetical protein